MVCSPCQDESSCPKPGQVSCHHCPRYLCLEHLSEHNQRNVQRLDDRSNQLNALNQFVVQLSTQRTLENARNELDEWKQALIRAIEKIHQNKYNEIDRLENELNTRLEIFREEIQSKLSFMQTQMRSLQKLGEISEKELSPIENDLSLLDQYVHSLTCEIDVKTLEPSFDDLVKVSPTFCYDHLALMEKPLKPYQTVPVENIKAFAASGEKETIVWVTQQDEVFRLDQHRQTHRLKLPDAGPSPEEKVMDLKWCPATARFLLLLLHSVFTFDPETDKWTSIPVVRYKNYPFRCICPRDRWSFYLSYDVIGMCVELWKYPQLISRTEPIERWDHTDTGQKNCLSSITRNSAGQLGLLRRQGTSCSTYFELRDQHFELLLSVDFSPNFIDAIYPFGDHHWLLQSLSDSSFRYSTETKAIDPLPYRFPFGFHEYGPQTIVMANEKNELLFCDT